MTPLIVANWKMNGTIASTQALLQTLPAHDNVVICPPFPLISLVAKLGFITGAQDCHAEECGAYTGEVSVELLRDVGCSYVILGHSERRQYYHETNKCVADKAQTAQKAGLKTIICIGETQEEYEAGQTLDVIKDQLINSLPTDFKEENTVIAYEPVWAIGSGKVPSEQDISSVHTFISETLRKAFEKNLRILYGGSVKAHNAGAIMRLPHVDGVLVGGASLIADEFKGIICS